MSLLTGESMHYARSMHTRRTQDETCNGAVQFRKFMPTILSWMMNQIFMKSRTNSLTGSPETTASSSTKYSESDDDSDRHSTAPSVETPTRNKESQFRKKDREMKRRESDDDDRSPVKFRQKNDEYSKRNHLQNSPRNHRHRHLSRSPEVRDENRRRTTKRNEEYRRRSRSREEYKRKRSRSRSLERPSHSPTCIGRIDIKKESSDDGDSHHQELDSLKKNAREDAIWAERRKERERRCEWGVRSVWGRSPLMHEIHQVYEEYEKVEEELRKEEEQLPQPLSVKAAEVAKKSKKKEKENKKKQKEKKKRKKKHKKSSSESEEEWVEVTAEMREAEAAREKLEEAAMIGPAIPDHLQQKHAALVDTTKRVNYGKDMLRGEAAAMASYIAQGKRIPRRGEIGLSSAEISEYEKIGYVMSGTRHKSMEATRLRKENQVMTAEEKRLLSGFTHDERKKKEEIVLQQFKSFIESKKGKN
uniref:Nkap_C domain-containing protein n=1 Tax=Onchocerca volvulus TaxID=6282 RepID=A0A8R1XTY5_ONCVO